jgi:zona occludens toxin
MAVNLITGRPGAGKSYEAVAFYVLPALKAGRFVITNLPLNILEFEKLNIEYGKQIILVHKTKENLRPFSTLPDYVRYEDYHNKDNVGPLYVIDECQEAVPRGDKNTSRDVREWYALHRHHVADILLMTQSQIKIHKEILTLVEHHISLSKNIGLGMRNRYRRFLRDGVGGPIIGKGVAIKYDKQYFPLYQTHTKKSGNEVNSNEKTIFSHWVFRYAFPIAGLLLVYLFSRLDLGHIFSPKPTKHAVESVGAISVPSQLPVVPHIETAPVVQKPEQDYPFKGYLFHIGGTLRINGTIKQYFSVRDPLGRFYRVTTQDLLAAGYSIGVASDCMVTLNHKNGDRWDENYATCRPLAIPLYNYAQDVTRPVHSQITDLISLDNAKEAPNSVQHRGTLNLSR